MSNPFNRTYSQDTTITRRTKQEAEMAINDLLKRGYEIVLPLTEKKSTENFYQQLQLSSEPL
jgi:ribulose bisphosphate carboxylase small subunit